MKIAVVGSRSFSDYQLLVDTLQQYDITEIVSGGARGADKLAEDYSKQYLKKEPKVFKADWDSEPELAGFIRNKLIVDYSDMVIAFWDGESSGTKDTMKYAKKKRKPVFVIYYLIDNPLGI